MAEFDSYDLIPMGLLILDEEQQISFANQQFREIFECTTADINGRAFENLFNPRDRMGVVKYHQLLGSYQGGVLDTEVSLCVDNDMVIPARIRMRRHDDRWVVMVESMEIEQKRIHDLSLAQKRLDTIVTYLGNGVLILDEQHAIRECNNEAFELLELRTSRGVKVTAEAIVGTPLFDFIFDQSFEGLRTTLTQAETDSSARFDETFQINNRYVQIRMNPIYVPRSGFIGSCVTVSNLTALREAEEELRRSEGRLAAILDASPVGVSVIDEDGTRKFVNARHAELLRQSKEELIGTVGVSSFSDTKIGEQIRADYARDGHVLNREVEYIRADGSRFWALLTLEPMEIDGRPARIAWFYDISDRKLAEAALVEKDAHLRLALDNMSDGLYVLDPDMRFAVFNDRYREVMGVPEDVLFPGSAAYDLALFMAKSGAWGDGDYAEFAKQRVAALANDEIIISETVTADNRILETRKTPIDGGGAVGLVTDITERKSTEEIMVKNQRLLDRIFEATPVPLAVVRKADATYIKANTATFELFGLSEAEMFKKRSPELYADAEDRNALLKELGENGIVKNIEVELRNFINQGNRNCLMSMIPAEYGDEDAYVVAAFDITERKRAEERLADAHAIITSSIQYASRIQRSTLPDQNLLDLAFTDNFVIWEPRDVVGGDIYWLLPAKGGYILGVADCTGHGVPGAFLTLVASSALRYAIAENSDAEPSQLIATMNYFIKDVLAQYTEDAISDDGLELGICRFNEDSKTMTFAGARFSLWIVTDGKACEVKGDKTGIGYTNVPIQLELKNHSVEHINDAFYYLFSDGFTDQVGGVRRRGYGKRRVVELLVRNADKPMAGQKEAILEAFKHYQGDEARRDDLTMVGFRI